MIGLSLSYCILDISNGKVRLEDVDKIITSAVPDKITGWAPYIARQTSKHGTWENVPMTARTFFMFLRLRNKIEIARQTRGAIPDIAVGHWVESEDEIMWVDIPLQDEL